MCVCECVCNFSLVFSESHLTRNSFPRIVIVTACVCLCVELKVVKWLCDQHVSFRRTVNAWILWMCWYYEYVAFVVWPPVKGSHGQASISIDLHSFIEYRPIFRLSKDPGRPTTETSESSYPRILHTFNDALANQPVRVGSPMKAIVYIVLMVMLVVTAVSLSTPFDSVFDMQCFWTCPSYEYTQEIIGWVGLRVGVRRRDIQGDYNCFFLTFVHSFYFIWHPQAVDIVTGDL